MEIITCPDTHKYAYANGDWCCKWNKDGNKRYISLASGSCQNIDFNTDFWECPERKSCRNHPSGKKSSDYFVCSSLKEDIMSKNWHMIIDYLSSHFSTGMAFQMYDWFWLPTWPFMQTEWVSIPLWFYIVCWRGILQEWKS